MHDVNKILMRSYELAAVRFHELVTLEHLLASLLEIKDIRDLIDACSGSAADMEQAVAEYLNDAKQHAIVRATSYNPRHTELLANVFKKARAQSIFSSNSEVNAYGLFLSMYYIEDSYASYFIDELGPDREDAIAYLNRTSSSQTTTNTSADDLAILDQYTLNLNKKASQGTIDPLIGRESEVEKITQILSRRTKHNAIMVGEPGVGKTVIMEGLAKRIVEKQVPETLLDKTVYSLDIAALVAGTKFRGDFEERMKQLISVLQRSPDAILFIDEIHMIMGAGSAGNSGGMDAANLLKPALGRGEIRCVGSTTLEEYRKYFEKDRALARRFQKLDINEPSVEDAKRIVTALIKYYGEYHDLVYDDSAVDAAVDLTVRHMHDKFLPDKALDVIDSAGAWQRIQPKEQRVAVISRQEIEQEVAKIAKVPVDTVATTEVDCLATLEQDLKNEIYGQDPAIEAVSNVMYLSRSGLREQQKTVGSFLFYGPTGTGKTELTRQLSKKLNIPLVRFDMSEYQESHTVSKLIGSPPGYVGFGDGASGSGLLINALEQTPHCILLFDEIEKAHPSVYNLFLQLMDYGRITSSSGKSASGNHAVVIFTTNLGAAEAEKQVMGFGKNEQLNDADLDAVKRFFSPEFRNRLDGMIKFNKHTTATSIRVIEKYINELNTLGAAKNVSVVFNKDAREWLVKHGFDSTMGARPLARIITEKVKLPLAKEILFGNLRNGGSAIVQVVKNKLEINYLDITAVADDLLDTASEKVQQEQ